MKTRSSSKILFDMRMVDVEVTTRDVERVTFECLKRGLNHSAKWLAEVNLSLKSKVEVEPQCNYDDLKSERKTYLLAKCHFDNREYDRCAYFTSKCKTPCAQFLHYYARYFSIERKKIENSKKLKIVMSKKYINDLQEICMELRALYSKNKLDAYCSYIFGIILKKLDLTNEARDALINCVNKEPLFWGGWFELAKIVTEKLKCKEDMIHMYITKQLKDLNLNEHWMNVFFQAQVFTELQLDDEAQHCYDILTNVAGFGETTYILGQIGNTNHSKRKVEASMAAYQKMIKLDPYNLEYLDTYSNILYIGGMKSDLTRLAQQATEIDKYRVETCSIVGNFYSLQGDHKKAVENFQRALRVNPNYVSAWILMGHEYMEMKNTNLSIQCYRHAIEANRREFRAWYGLGQAYEILQMYSYSLYYYKEAQCLRSNDSRMLIALGDMYDKLDNDDLALKCYFRARAVGDPECTALLKVANLYSRQGDPEKAARIYKKYIFDCEQSKNKAVINEVDLARACQYLSNIYFTRNCLDLAWYYSNKCLLHEETKGEAKALLKAISQKKQAVPNNSSNNSDVKF